MINIRKLPRIIGTGFCFVCFGVGGLIASVTVLPLLILRYPNQDERQVAGQKLIHSMFKGFVWLMMSLGIIKFEARQLQHMAEGKGKIIVANHPSLIDVVLIIATFPRATCIVKQGVYNNPFMRMVVRTAGYIVNSEPEIFLAACAKKLEAGETIVLFPEGTRSVPGQKLHFQRGAANIAIKSKADFLPVLVSCNPPTLLKSEKWYQVPESCPKFEITFQSPFKIDTIICPDDSDSIASRKLTRELEAYFIELIKRNTDDRFRNGT